MWVGESLHAQQTAVSERGGQGSEEADHVLHATYRRLGHLTKTLCEKPALLLSDAFKIMKRKCNEVRKYFSTPPPNRCCRALLNALAVRPVIALVCLCVLIRAYFEALGRVCAIDTRVNGANRLRQNVEARSD
jgi:hypothetical protein